MTPLDFERLGTGTSDQPLDDTTRRNYQLKVAGRAHDTTDLRTLLDMLGLLPDRGRP